MSETNPEILRALETKLTNLSRCILNEAERNDEFARRLEEVLISDSLRNILGETKKKPQKDIFNSVGFLHENGEGKLREELERKTDSELREILRSEGIKKGKELKVINRQQVIEEIITNSQRRLTQGASFL
jgi:hypothetical protein